MILAARERLREASLTEGRRKFFFKKIYISKKIKKKYFSKKNS